MAGRARRVGGCVRRALIGLRPNRGPGPAPMPGRRARRASGGLPGRAGGSNARAGHLSPQGSCGGSIPRAPYVLVARRPAGPAAGASGCGVTGRAGVRGRARDPKIKSNQKVLFPREGSVGAAPGAVAGARST